MKAKGTIVRVTAEDLRDGKYMDNLGCPIARALKRAFPGLDVNVGGTFFTLGYQEIEIKFNNISPRLQQASKEIFQGKARPFWFRVRGVQK